MLKWLMAFLFVFPLWGSVTAEALRCGSQLVVPGDLALEVLAKCGEPDATSQWQVARNGFGRNWYGFGQQRSYSTVEEWTYNFGQRHFLKVLRFENGHLVSIESAGRGF